MPATKHVRVAYAGVGFTELTRAPVRSEAELGIEACRRAAEDAGLDSSLIDGLSIQVHHYPPPETEAIVEALGIREVRWDFEGKDRIGAGSIGPVALALDRGDCRIAIVCKIMNTMAPVTTPLIDPATGRVSGDDQFEVPYGLGYTMQRLALTARRYMHRYGVTAEQVGSLCVQERRHAALHPWSFYRQPLTLEQYLSSRWISDPLRLLDCDTPVNGAFAYIVTTADVAKDLRHPPVYLKSWAEGPPQLPHHLDAEPGPGMSPIARTLYRDAGVGPKEMDIAFPYDGFSFLSLMWMENLGLVGRGEAGAFVEGGSRMAIDGELPMNTHGGQLSQGRLHGHGFVMEAIEQIRGTAGRRQVPRPVNHAVISSGMPNTGFAAVFGRE